MKKGVSRLLAFYPLREDKSHNSPLSDAAGNGISNLSHQSDRRRDRSFRFRVSKCDLVWLAGRTRSVRCSRVRRRLTTDGLD